MILEVSVSRIVSMLYIFRIYGKFANTFFKKCWQIFRCCEICQHLTIFMTGSTNFDARQNKKCCQKSAKTKNCTTFPIILQMAQHYKPNIILFGVPKGMKG